jgi:hypothetical protein
MQRAVDVAQGEREMMNDVLLVVGRPADVDEQDAHRQNALRLAAEAGHEDSLGTNGRLSE